MPRWILLPQFWNDKLLLMPLWILLSK
jgi:hypothetical protein